MTRSEHRALVGRTIAALADESARHPFDVLLLSDAGAHLSFLCDAGFGLHLFGHWVRDRRDLTLEEAVKRVTSDVASAYRIADCGRPGRVLRQFPG